MNPIALCAGAFHWVLQTSWQAAVLASLVLLTQLVFRRKLSAGWRYGLWLLVVARLLIPGSPQTVFSIFNLTRFAESKQPAALPQEVLPSRASITTEKQVPGRATAPVASTLSPPNQERISGSETGPAPAATSPSVRGTKMPLNWYALLCAVWLTGVGALCLREMLAGAQFRSRMAKSASVRDANALQLLSDCAESLGLRQRVTLIETKCVASPSVWGLWRKRLLLPSGSLERFSTAELRHIFLHELAHLKRRDLEVNWLAGILQILHWFNPVLWLAFARMRADRELATDALALKHASNAEEVRYGETILKVLEGLSGSPLRHGLVGIAESKARMKERLLAIVNRRGTRPWRWAAAGIVVALALAGLTDAQQQARNDHSQKGFTLRFVDIDSGTPLSGVAVDFTLDYFGGNSKKQQVVTDKNGRAKIEMTRNDLKHLAYEAQKPNYLRLRGEWFDQQIDSIGPEYEVKLAQGTEIGGSVTEESGKPVAGAEVSVDEPMNMLLSGSRSGSTDSAEVWSMPSGERIATTDASGHWKARCIWPGIQWASLRIHHPDFADATCSTELTSAMEAEGKGMKVTFNDLVRGKVTVKLGSGTNVAGHVVDEAGKPLRGIRVDCAELLLQPHALSDRLLGQRSAMTDSTGKFHFDHVPAKPLYFSIQAPGYAPAFAEWNSNSGPSEVELRLIKGMQFSGRVVDNKDNPVPAAQVKFADFSVWRGINWSTVADENGRFEWAHAPAEQFQLEIQKDGFITQRKIIHTTNGPEIKIRLNPVLVISGHVLDADNKQPLKNFRIEWIDRGDPKDFNQGYPYSTVNCSDGVFSLDLGRFYSQMWMGGYAHQCVFRVQADGFAPFVSRVFESRKHDVGEVSYDVEMKPVSQLFGKVVNPGGHRVAGAQVAVIVPGAKLLLNGEPVFSNAAPGAVSLTDVSGQFHLNPDPAALGLVAVSEEGCAILGTNDLSTNMLVKLQPWGRIQGTVWKYDQLLTNQSVWVAAKNWNSPEPSLRIFLTTNTDAQGRFAFNFVPPVKYGISSSGPSQVVQVEPGATAFVKIGGMGRPVVGRFSITNEYLPIDWPRDQGFHYAHSIWPQPPKGLKTREEIEAWQNRPEIQKAYDEMRNYTIQIAADGSFRIDQVAPGKYEMQLEVYDPRDPDSMAYSKYIINVDKPFEVPESDSRGPLDLGTVEIGMKPDIKKGQTAAPDFVATNLTGGTFKLSDYRGKYVLLDFWATWCGPCIGEIPYLRQVHEKFKDRKDFVMLSLSIDNSINEVREFQKKNDMPWIQGFIGQSGAAAQYGFEGIPAIFLISPEGKIIESDLGGGSMVERVGKELKRASASRL